MCYRKDYLQTWGEFFFSLLFFFVDKNRNTGFSSRHLLRLQKFCMNSRFRTGIFGIQWYCFARVFDDHRSWQKLINYITNIKAKSKQYHWIPKIPVLKRLFIQNFCKRSRCLEENPVFLLFGVTNNGVSNDAFRTFTFSMQQSVSFTWPKNSG
jgi:hypothetical protein